MASAVNQAKITALAPHFPVAAEPLGAYQESFDEHRHRIYSLAFWMTDNEMTAEEIAGSVFRRAFAASPVPTSETLDKVLLSEIRELMPVGILCLSASVCSEISSVRHNVKRVHLERAVVQLPPTERLVFLLHDVEGYDHARIAHTLGMEEQESQFGLHQARLCVRELVSSMV